MTTNVTTTFLGTTQICDKRFNPNSDANVLSATTEAAVAGGNSAIDTQLATLDAAYYTAEKLQQLGLNDKKYALRLGYDSAGI